MSKPSDVQATPSLGARGGPVVLVNHGVLAWSLLWDSILVHALSTLQCNFQVVWGPCDLLILAVVVLRSMHMCPLGLQTPSLAFATVALELSWSGCALSQIWTLLVSTATLAQP